MAVDEGSPVGRVMALAVEYMSQPGNRSGGHLAPVLDEQFGAGDTIRDCREDAEDAGDTAGVELADALLALHGIGFVARVRKYAHKELAARGENT